MTRRNQVLHGVSRGRARQWVMLACGVMVLGFTGSMAGAQVVDTWAIGSGLDIGFAVPSARLDGMGGMREAVADENNEIHLLDFVGNLTGHLTDKPVSHIDMWSGPQRWKDLTTVELGDQDYTALPTGFAFNLKPEPRTAFGGSFGFIEGTSDRLVTRSLRQIFILPLEDEIDQPTNNEVFEAGLRAPRFSAHYARQITDKLAGGFEWSYVFQRELKTTPVIYKINTRSDTHVVKASLAYEILPASAGGLFRGLVVGANGELGKAWIKGESRDEVHADLYTWDRPLVGASIHAISGLGTKMKAGVDFRYSSFEGRETVAYNWSTLFVLNPTERTVQFDRAVLEEGKRFKSATLRWEKMASDDPYYLSFSFTALQDQYWQTPQLNVNAYVLGKNLQETTWQAVGGGAYYLPAGRGLIGGELAYGFRDIDDRISRPTRRTPTSNLELGVGGEYYPWMKLGFRAGYRRMAFDGYRGLDDPSRDTSTNRFAGGVALRTADGVWQIDAGYMIDYVRNEDPDPSAEDETRSRFTLQVRWLL